MEFVIIYFPQSLRFNDKKLKKFGENIEGMMINVFEIKIEEIEDLCFEKSSFKMVINEPDDLCYLGI